jgi:putative Holliday junction resolvase
MGRIMGLDVGEKTIGIAWSDESGFMAFPGETLLRQEGYRKDMGRLKSMAEERDVTEVVIGLPLMMDGERGIQAEKVEEFTELLRRYVKVPIHLQDERLSTAEVEKVMISAGVHRKDRKKSVDSMAACVILQSYLDIHKIMSRNETRPDIIL